MNRTMSLPHEAHTSRPWRIHEVASDFRVEDVWELRVTLGSDDLPRLVEMILGGDPARAPRPVRALFAVRTQLGRLLGWDQPATGADTRAPTLRDRLPADLRDTPTPDSGPFSPLYLVEDEFAGEVANRTMHGVLHLGRVPDAAGGYHAQMAVLVKPNGLLGRAYMAAIKPFRHLVVYPALIRQWERAW